VRECRVQSVRELEPGIGEPVEAIVRRALAKDPDDRYQTAGEMQKEIEAVLHTFKPTPDQEALASFMRRLYGDEAQAQPAAAVAASVAAVPATGAEVPAVPPVGRLDATEPARRRPWLLPVAALVVLAVGAGVYFVTRGGAPASAGANPPASSPAAAAAAPAVAPAPAPSAGAPGAVPVAAGSDIQQRLAEAQKQQEEQLARQLEEQRQKMQAELKAQPTPTAKPAATAMTAPAPQPSAAPTRAIEEPAPLAAVPVAPQPTEAPAPPPVPEPAAPEPAPAAPTVNEGDFVAPGTAGLAPPAFVSVNKPEYPALAKRLGVQGVVVVSVLVDAQGAVEQVRLVKGITQKVGINEAALAAARSARYRPATYGGVRVKTWANMSIPFKM
jgi:TonB family protein